MSGDDPEDPDLVGSIKYELIRSKEKWAEEAGC
jgi:hypothetical protein